MAKKRVLIVDDEADVREAIRFALESEAIECMEAEDGAAAIELARRERPDLIVLDVMMPKMNGFQVAKRLRSGEEYTGVVIVMVTAKAQIGDIAAGVETGADAYITKPFEMDSLVREVRQRLGQRFHAGTRAGMPVVAIGAEDSPPAAATGAPAPPKGVPYKASRP